jgi:hypothetical protein
LFAAEDYCRRLYLTPVHLRMVKQIFIARQARMAG